MFEGIRKYFNERAALRRDRRDFQKNMPLLFSAVENADMPEIDRLTGAVSESRFFTPAVQGELIQKALGTDNMDVLYATLNGKSPDVWFDTLASGEKCDILSHEHILHRAIVEGQKNIALGLANHPDTDVLAVGHDQKIVYDIGTMVESLVVSRFTTPHQSLSQEAREHGMADVADILDTRALTAKRKSFGPPKEKVRVSII